MLGCAHLGPKDRDDAVPSVNGASSRKLRLRDRLLQLVSLNLARSPLERERDGLARRADVRSPRALHEEAHERRVAVRQEDTANVRARGDGCGDGREALGPLERGRRVKMRDQRSEVVAQRARRAVPDEHRLGRPVRLDSRLSPEVLRRRALDGLPAFHRAPQALLYEALEDTRVDARAEDRDAAWGAEDALRVRLDVLVRDIRVFGDKERRAEPVAERERMGCFKGPRRGVRDGCRCLGVADWLDVLLELMSGEAARSDEGRKDVDKEGSVNAVTRKGDFFSLSVCQCFALRYQKYLLVAAQELGGHREVLS